MKRRMVALLLALVFCVWAVAAAAKPHQNKSQTAANQTRAQAPSPDRNKKVQPAINPDQAYKANCSRCHLAPRKFSDRVTATVVRHMRVRANLTAEEEKAILEYLTE